MGRATDRDKRQIDRLRERGCNCPVFLFGHFGVAEIGCPKASLREDPRKLPSGPLQGKSCISGEVFDVLRNIGWFGSFVTLANLLSILS